MKGDYFGTSWHSYGSVGLEMDIDLAKGFNNTMSDFTKPQNIAGW